MGLVLVLHPRPLNYEAAPGLPVRRGDYTCP